MVEDPSSRINAQFCRALLVESTNLAYVRHCRSSNRVGSESPGRDMTQKKETAQERPPEEGEGVTRQSKALEEIDKLIKSDEPAGEKLKKIVEDHSAACDEIKEQLADGTRQ
jgi:hypothetical protein